MNVVEAWKRGRARRRSAQSYQVDRSKVLTSIELAALLKAAEGEFPAHFPLVVFLADTGLDLERFSPCAGPTSTSSMEKQ